MKKIRDFFNNVIRKDTQESTKRIVSIITGILIGYVVIRYTTVENAIRMVATLCGFVLALLGVAVWEDVSKEKIKRNE